MLENQIPSMPVLIEDLGMIYPNNNSKEKRRYGLYLCQCGNSFTTRISTVKNGSTLSCGCYLKRIRANSRTHGLTNHRLYYIWTNIINRTSNKNNIAFKDYGGRGITVCDRWKDVANFIEDMYPTYKEGLSIDRINNDGNYEPSNCRWATQEVQHRNTRIIMSTNTSGYRGVHYNKQSNKWMARIVIDYKLKYIGSFNTALEAAKAYDTYVIENNLEHNMNKVLQNS